MYKYSFQDTLNTPINLLKVLGAWPTGNRAVYWLYTFFVLCTVQIPLPALTLIKFINNNKFSVIGLANCIFLNLHVATVPITTVSLALSNEKLQRLLEALDSEVFNSYTHHNFSIIEDGASAVKKIMHYIPLCFFTVSLTAILPIAHLKDMPLFMDMWFPFDPRGSWFSYCAVHLYTSGALMVCALINASLVTLSCALMIHGSTQIKILKYNLKNLIHQGTQEEIYTKIVQCTLQYVAIINYVDLVQKSLSLALGIQFLSCTIVLCLSSFLITVTPLTEFIFFIIVSYLCCLILEAYLLCYFGERLRTESLTINYAAYFTLWSNFEMRCKKALLLLMERGKVPLQIAPVGLFVLSKVTFTKLMQRAYSLFNVLRKIEVAEK